MGKANANSPAVMTPNCRRPFIDIGENMLRGAFQSLHRGCSALSFLEAGLLTSFRRMLLPAFNDTLLINKMPTAVDLLHANDKGTYSCGTVGDSHPIPF